jgi:hypothetical protein
MLRIPGSINSKKNNDGGSGRQVVKIIQKWNGHKPRINLLLEAFYVYLADQKLKESITIKKHDKKRNKKYISYGGGARNSNGSNSISWIETLLLQQTPIKDNRKFVIWHVLCPYLLNVKKLTYEQSFRVIKDWLHKCNELERLSFNANQKIKEGLKSAASKGYLPISFEKLKIENKELYDELKRKEE